MSGQGYRPVLCLDEVEELTERPAFNDDFFDGLRALGSQGHLAFVTASNDPLDTLIQQSGRSSRFYNIFTQLNLAGLDDPAARPLLAALAIWSCSIKAGRPARTGRTLAPPAAVSTAGTGRGSLAGASGVNPAGPAGTG